MQYIKVAQGIWVEYDATAQTSRVIKRQEIQNEIAFCRQQIDALPPPVTNAEYLAWGKANYPLSGQEQSRQLLRQRIDALQVLLDQLRDA